jgi:hypothetical protein
LFCKSSQFLFRALAGIAGWRGINVIVKDAVMSSVKGHVTLSKKGRDGS